MHLTTKFILYIAGNSVFLLMGALGITFNASNKPTINFEISVNQSPIIPLHIHTWLSDIHGEAHYNTCMLLAGILFKMGAYGLVQINMKLLSDAHFIFSSWLIIVDAIQIIHAA
jgi:NAD(P)H-quinone oxidoreductase subunit 4